MLLVHRYILFVFSSILFFWMNFSRCTAHAREHIRLLFMNKKYTTNKNNTWPRRFKIMFEYDLCSNKFLRDGKLFYKAKCLLVGRWVCGIFFQNQNNQNNQIWFFDYFDFEKNFYTHTARPTDWFTKCSKNTSLAPKGALAC